MEPFRILEWGATFVESIVILSTIAAVSQKRQQDLRHYCLLVLSAVSLTVLTGFMNSISAFSFLTPLVAMCFIVLVLSYILSDGTLLVRSTTCIMAYFVVVTMGYIFCALLGLFNGWSEDTFSILITPGVPRAIFLIVDKTADIILYFLVRGVLPKICSLKRRFQLALLFICSIAYVSVQYLFSTFLYSSVTMLHSIVLISWVYIFSFLIIVVVSFILIARSEQERQTHMLLKATNQLLTDNYQQLHAYQQNHAKQIHDFNHHLTAIKGLAAMKKHEEISDYIDSLLSIAYQETALCHSGCDIIDAIINHKAAEAKDLGITFNFTAHILAPNNIDPVDICGVLANQIDNAFDACRQIPSPGLREVKVTIKQVENFMFFRVENTVEHDPFKNNSSLASTKTDVSTQHGLGLKNIGDIANKYSGFLRNEFKDGHFISVVSLCYEPLDT